MGREGPETILFHLLESQQRPDITSVQLSS